MASGVRTRKAPSPLELDVSSLNNVERLIFAQAVHEFGSDSWQEVSKLLSQHPLVDQPKGAFTPQSCFALYKRLMDDAGLEWSETDTAPRLERHLRLAQRFYVARVTELKGLIAAEEVKFRKVATEIDEIRSGAWDHKILVSIGAEPETPPVVVDLTGPQEVEEPEPAKPEERVEEEEEEEEEEQAVQVSEPSQPPLKLPKEAEDDIIDISDTPPPTQPDSEHDMDEKEEGSDNDAVNELINDFGSDKPTAETQETEEVPPAPKQLSPDVDAADEMQVDQETVQDDERHSEPSIESPKQEEPVVSKDSPQAAQEDDELEAECAPSARPEGKRKVSDEDVDMLDAEREKKRPREDSELDEDDEGRSTPQTPFAPEPSPQPHSDAPKTRRSLRPTTASNTAASGSSSAGAAETPHVVSKRFQNMIGMLHSQISQHRFGNIFHNPIKKSEAPDYLDIVKRPMDLKTIKSRVKDGLITNSLEFQRDIFLMFANAMMYNRPGSEIYNMAEEMMISSERDINAFRQTEGFHRM